MMGTDHLSELPAKFGEKLLAHGERLTSTTRGTLLIVDDEPGPRGSLSIVFKDRYDILIATCGQEAIDLAKKKPIDVAIVDIKMPDLSGIEVLKALKDIDPTTEVVILTGFESIETARAAVRYGAADYLNKPFNVFMLRELSERVFARRAIEKRLMEHDPELYQRYRGLRLQVYDLKIEADELRREVERLSVDRKMLHAQARANLPHAANSWREIAKRISSQLFHTLRSARDVRPPMTSDTGQPSRTHTSNFAVTESKLEGEVLENVTAAFIHRLINEVNNARTYARELEAIVMADRENSPAKLRETSRQLDITIDDILYLFQRFRNTMGRHPGVLKPINVQALLADVHRHLDSRFPEKVMLQPSQVSHEVLGDYELMWHLFENLIRNGLDAIQGKDEGRVIVTTSNEITRAAVRVTVEDNGPGIPPDVLPRIYNPSYTTKPKGLGIGLYLVVRAVKLHHGSIECVSEPAVGTKFHVVLPLKESVI